ncbi:hypothetical protein [Metabacillus fastidiosus]|nr:hypothetical protein [Metabacillus fastidiosus]
MKLQVISSIFYVGQLSMNNRKEYVIISSEIVEIRWRMSLILILLNTPKN